MSDGPLHAFGDDALGEHDGVELARLIRRGELSEREVREAAVARARRMGALAAIAVESFDAPTRGAAGGVFAGVPMFVKDNVDMAGLPTGHGTRALRPRPAVRHSAVVEQLLSLGFSAIGKSRLPEFGFSPSNEYEHDEPSRNPWNLQHTSGASSGGSAALVAAGVVPLAHGNDGGGSIRIPASCCGLVGLKPTRGRLVDGELARQMPVKIVTEGVLTRSVRDTAHFYAGAERHFQNRRLPPIGLVEGPSSKRLRVGLVLDSINDVKSCPETRQVIERTARALERLGHRVEPMVPPVPSFFIEDFKIFWGMLAFALSNFGGRLAGVETEADKLDGLTLGLARYYRKHILRTPLAIARLQGSSLLYARAFRKLDVVLSPVVSHAAPKLGYFKPSVPFDELFARILRFTAFTPLNNATGGPAISLPAGRSQAGVPIGAHFSAAHGAERTLLELAYELEAELGFPRIQQPSAAARAPSQDLT